MKRLDSHSQHFLRSPNFVKMLIGHTNIRARDTVLDIGAGSGVITAALVARCAHVIALEPEPSALAKLKENLQKHPSGDRCTVERADIMRYTLPKIPYKVFANIPFHLSSPIVQKLTHDAHPPKSIFLIVQKQFGQKLCSNDRRFTSLLGAQLAPWWTVRVRKPLKKTDFTPPPAVDTVLLEIKPRETPLIPIAYREQYEAYMQRIFTDFTYYQKQRAAQPKPSQLTTEQYVALFEHKNI